MRFWYDLQTAPWESTASCINSDVHCLADGPLAAPDCSSRPDGSCSWWRTTGHRCCSSPAWQHAPQVLHEVAVDVAENANCQRPPACPRRRKTSTVCLQAALRLPDASALWAYTLHHCTLNTGNARNNAQLWRLMSRRNCRERVDKSVSR